MKRALYAVILCDLLFFLFLVLVSMSEGDMATVLYYLAFLLPIAIGVLAIRWGACCENVTMPKLLRRNFISALPFVFPIVLAVLLVSYLTAFILGDRMAYFGTTDVGDDLLIAIVSHALIPAIFEEALFRFIPLRLLGGHSPRYAVILTSFFFALVHHSVVSMPYAFVAGIALAALTLACDSIYPAIVIHFVNNLASVLSLYFVSNFPGVNDLIWLAVGGLTLVSFIFIIIKRREYSSALSSALAVGDGYDGGLSPLIIAIPTVFVAAVELYAVLLK